MAASGIAIADEVVDAFQTIKTKKTSKYILFKINDAHNQIVVHSVSPKDATYQDFRRELDEVGPVYAIYDYHYVTKLDQPNQKLFFVMWCPEGTKIKMKMMMSSSKDALKNKLIGFQHELQATDADEISEESFEGKLKDVKPRK